jgi:hypothetical protein
MLVHQSLTWCTRMLTAKMPKGTIDFKCVRINLKRIATLESDENQVDSLIEFDFKIGRQRPRHLCVKVRQGNGTDLQSQPLEVGKVIGYDGPWNDAEFRELCQRYYCDVIEACRLGDSIKRGARNLIERVAVRFHRREEMSLPPSLETKRHGKARRPNQSQA